MKPRLFIPAAGCALLAFGIQTASAEPPYLDDRSTPETLIRSLYNAIDRKEYARAYAYFGNPPAKTVEAYAEGYADTENVEVIVGAPSEDGAAGSIFYSLPVAIRARNTNGEEHVFAGCYDFRFVQPSVQTNPYTPLMIERGRLEPTEIFSAEAFPASCGEGAQETDVLLRRAERLFADVYDGVCSADEIGIEEEPESHTIRFNYEYDAADAPPKEARLFRFLCDRGAYNEIHVYLLADENGAILPLRFATPELDIQYENGDTDGRVEGMSIIGYRAEDQLVNSDFDPETLTLTSHAKWRGVGDASSSAQWIFRSGAFTLVHYEADPSYDGEINPETLLDYNTGP